MVDLAINYQKLRHGRLAGWARRAIYRLCAGPDGWPLVFTAPGAEDPTPGGSPHVYVHLPFCRTICPHCPYNKAKFDPGRAERYEQSLLREVRAYLDGSEVAPIESLYLGGGTPSLTPDLAETVIRRFAPALAPGAEVAMEVHPADATPRGLARLRQMGINKISLGIETFRADLLEALGRGCTPEAARRAIVDASRAGFDCLDVNLIYGIPGQRPRDAVRDAEEALALDVDQISAYPLFTFVHTAMGKRVAGGRMAAYGDRARLKAQRAISELCRSRGYDRTSVWSFTRHGTRPYTTVTRDTYRGFGAGAGSKVDGVFWFNTFSVDAYASLTAHRPALVHRSDDRFRRLHWLYWRIYCTSIDPEEYRRLFDREVERDFPFIFRVMRVLGWIRRTDGVWRLTEGGAVWSHRLQCLFSLTYIDRLWQQCQEQAWPERVVLA